MKPKDVVSVAALVRAGSSHTFHLRSAYPLAKCVGVRIAAEREAVLLVMSATVDHVEQLLGAGVPAEFFGTEPVNFDPQKISGAGLMLTIENVGEVDAHAGISVEFDEVLTSAVAKVWH